MQPQIFLKKDDQELPDNYGLTVMYHDGSEETFEIASHSIPCRSSTKDFNTGRQIFSEFPDSFIELRTKNDEVVLIPFCGVRRFSFDKRWSKVVALREEAAEKKVKDNV